MTFIVQCRIVSSTLVFREKIRTQQSNPELNTVSDRHSVPSDNTVTAEGYRINK